MAKRKKTKTKKINYPSWLIVIIIVILLTGFIYHFITYNGQDNMWSFIGDIKEAINKPSNNEPPNNEPPNINSDELSIHFLELGNKYNGDAIYIKAGDNDILIDAGSRTKSASAIHDYLNDYVTDNKLEYVIATHAHQDHIAGFVSDGTTKGIFELYETGTIIDFALTNSTTNLYSNYQIALEKEIDARAKHYTALECYNNTNGAQKTYELSEGITMTILYNYYYEHKASSENDYSVCLLITQGDKNFLFTGDLEEGAENKLITSNKLPQVTLFKAPHHGSSTSSGENLLAVIKPEIVVCCCVCGFDEYHAAAENIFPSQKFVTNTGKYTDKIYITSIQDINDVGYTSLNGSVVVTSDGETVVVHGTNNDTLFKDTTWAKENRIWPTN